MRPSTLIGFLGFILLIPLLIETLIIESVATDMKIYGIRKIAIFAVYLPTIFGLIGSLLPKSLKTISGCLLFISGIIILIPGIIFGLIIEYMFFGVLGGILFIISGTILLLKTEKK